MGMCLTCGGKGFLRKQLDEMLKTLEGEHQILAPPDST